MNGMYFVFLSVVGLTLSSCFSGKGFNSDGSVEPLEDEPGEQLEELYKKLDLTRVDKGFTQRDRELLDSRCVAHPFSQRENGYFYVKLCTELLDRIELLTHVELSDQQKRLCEEGYLYGRRCIEGRHLIIQTGEGSKVSSFDEPISLEKGEAGALGQEEKPDFINEVYKTPYKILKGQGSDRDIPFLTDFLPESESFFGSQNVRYRIIFEVEENSLVLYKSSTKLEDIPYMERTSMKEVIESDTTYYRVPFLIYPFKYCRALSIQNQRKKNLEISYYEECEDVRKEDATYLKIILADKKVLEYV